MRRCPGPNRPEPSSASAANDRWRELAVAEPEAAGRQNPPSLGYSLVMLNIRFAAALRFDLMILTLAALAAAALTGAHPASAACIDPPRPGVNWKQCDLSERNLPNVDLSGSALRDARFIRAQLPNANFTEAHAHRAKFITANLANALFDGATLTEVDFTKADLSGASFRNADLRRARLFRADLSGADLTGARIDGADLLNANLSGTRWVDGVTICAEGSKGTCN